MKKFLPLLFTFLLATSCTFSVGIAYENSSKYSVMTDSMSIDSAITDLDLTWYAGSVSIEYYDKSYISVSESCVKPLNDRTRLHYYLDGTTLYIQFCDANLKKINNLQKKLIIRLPAGMAFDNFDMTSMSGDFNFTNIIADKAKITSLSGDFNGSFASDVSKMNIDLSSGDLRIDAWNIDELVAESSSGDIIVNAETIYDLSLISSSGKRKIYADYIMNADLESSSGKTIIQSKLYPIDSLVSDTSSGETEVYIPENDGFIVKISKSSGSFESDFEVTGDNSEKRYKNCSRVYKVKMSSGNFSLNRITE